jgi:hypothetical protein
MTEVIEKKIYDASLSIMVVPEREVVPGKSILYTPQTHAPYPSLRHIEDLEATGACYRPVRSTVKRRSRRRMLDTP